MSNINLDGAEISIIKTLGFGGAPMTGRELASRVGGIGDSELFQVLSTLCNLGYVSSTKDLARLEDLEETTFHVNPGYSKELREALDPRPVAPTRRVRRE